MTPEKDTVEILSGLVDELVTRVAALEAEQALTGRAIARCGQRITCLEGGWQRHGLEMSRDRDDLHRCKRRCLHLGGGECLDPCPPLECEEL